MAVTRWSRIHYHFAFCSYINALSSQGSTQRKAWGCAPREACPSCLQAMKQWDIPQEAMGQGQLTQVHCRFCSPLERCSQLTPTIILMVEFRCREACIIQRTHGGGSHHSLAPYPALFFFILFVIICYKCICLLFISLCQNLSFMKAEPLPIWLTIHPQHL